MQAGSNVSTEWLNTAKSRHPYSSCVATETVKKPAKRENKNLLLLLEPQNRILLIIRDNQRFRKSVGRCYSNTVKDFIS